ncbi:hypothetical protein E2C01_006715 [Portunus trituberculatus]|uniref:Uncharacterized protein n=1 Tax=Portunus trituberculatus TaxID=210409 RepID=A0A5B7CYK5_PORTR|nr:hypothetical protein [Portunus trituberculatus]
MSHKRSCFCSTNVLLRGVGQAGAARQEVEGCGKVTGLCYISLELVLLTVSPTLGLKQSQ